MAGAELSKELQRVVNKGTPFSEISGPNPLMALKGEYVHVKLSTLKKNDAETSQPVEYFGTLNDIMQVDGFAHTLVLTNVLEPERHSDPPFPPTDSTYCRAVLLVSSRDLLSIGTMSEHERDNYEMAIPTPEE